MLNLQAQTLEQQERLYKNQVRLKIREILQQELNFYQQALGNISNTAALLGGFALMSMQIIPVFVDPTLSAVETIYYFLALSTTGICLLTVVAAQFSSLFSMRVALRGGETSVEDTIAKIRGEYQLVLLMLVVGIELFLICIPFLITCKLSVTNSIMGFLLIFPMCYFVVYFYRRSKEKFHLKDDDRFMSSKNDGTSNKTTYKDMNYLKNIDQRNEDRNVPNYAFRSKNKTKSATRSPLQVDDRLDVENQLKGRKQQNKLLSKQNELKRINEINHITTDGSFSIKDENYFNIKHQNNENYFNFDNIKKDENYFNIDHQNNELIKRDNAPRIRTRSKSETDIGMFLPRPIETLINPQHNKYNTSNDMILV